MKVNLLHALLKDASKLYPENIAVRYNEQEISYAEIDALSDRLASFLVREGIRKEDRVGIYLDKSIDAVISIFGILKSGACYVPFDPMSPLERHRYILNDCSINWLVTSSKRLFFLQEILMVKTPLSRVLIIDAQESEFKQSDLKPRLIFKWEIFEANRGVPDIKIEDDNLAYILYTSGSTGKPKGVMVTHIASLAFINWAYNHFVITPESRLSCISPIHFDLSIFDIFVSIKAGATICLVPQGMSGFSQSLAEFIEREKISTCYSTPSILIRLILYGGLENKDLSALRQILFAGEKFPVKYLRKLMQLVPYADFCNLYGPTETNVCTFYHLPQNHLLLDDNVPVGKPFEGVEVFILDEFGNQVKGGEIGELYVAGPTLMKGYWNDDQKTDSVLSKKFASFREGVKMYKTGDLGSICKSGEILFHGRIDSMVKSRGYRIELGEIESVLYEHPAINEAVAIAIPNDEIGNKIKAVIVLKNGYFISQRDIKTFCSRKLPSYMIPEIIEFKDKFPRTSTDKIDREGFKVEN